MGSHSVKTSLLNFVRRLFANRLAEAVFVPVVKGNATSNFFSRFVPMPYLYPSPSWRTVTRHGLRLKLDISDLVDWHIYYGFYDPSHEFLFRQIKPTDHILDIGANIGYISMRLGQVATHGSVIGFEPSPYNFSKCQSNLSLNQLTNVKIYNMGLARKEGILPLIMVDSNNRGMNKIQIDENSDNTAESIEVSTIDLWIKRNSVSRIDFIKLDVEGYEMEVLKGAEDTIRKFKPRLFLEVNNTFLKGYGSSSFELFEWLQARGYSLFDMNNKSIVSHGLSLSHHSDVYASSKQ